MMSDTQTQTTILNTTDLKVHVNIYNVGKSNGEDTTGVNIRVTNADESFNVGESWPYSKLPYEIRDSTPPSEMLEHIEARLKDYWINTSRRSTEEGIAKIRTQIDAIDIAWANGKIEAAQKRIAEQQKIVDKMQSFIASIRSEATK